MEYIIIIIEIGILIGIFSTIYAKLRKKLQNLGRYEQIIRDVNIILMEYQNSKPEIQRILGAFHDFEIDYKELKDQFETIPEQIDEFKQEYLALKQDFVTLISMPPDKYADKLIPITDKLITHYASNPAKTGMQIPPIKITGNKGIDGLISMFVNNKLANQPPKTQPQESGPIKDNPFE